MDESYVLQNRSSAVLGCFLSPSHNPSKPARACKRSFIDSRCIVQCSLSPSLRYLVLM